MQSFQCLAGLQQCRLRRSAFELVGLGEQHMGLQFGAVTPAQDLLIVLLQRVTNIHKQYDTAE